MNKLTNGEVKKIREEGKVFAIASNFERQLWNSKDEYIHTRINNKSFKRNEYFGLIGEYYSLPNNIIKCVRLRDFKRIVTFWKIA